MNTLTTEKSPYLLQHASNPVHWQPWGEAAFAQARREQKPIFLSIGYSTCHWCHVMAHESFENAALAELLNRHYVAIKVDREERPDVDHLYMMFVQATTGSGGWPMSVWLTPELRPFYGGTYFPPSDRWGRPGFGTVLQRIADLWQSDRENIEKQSHQVLLNLAQSQTGSDAAPGALSDEALDHGLASLADHYEPRFGGFSDAPKFPRPAVFHFLFRQARRAGTPKADRDQALHMALHTLEKMEAGGLHDHLGGGFHRYSVDGFWHVPHFEKMLYDQAQLATAYLEAYQITGAPRHEETVRAILEYVRRDLTDTGGAFYSAEDADSLLVAGQPEHAEGAFYVWTHEEILRELGGDKGARLAAHYGVRPEGNAPPDSDPHGEFTGKNILYRQMEPGAEASLLQECRAQLFRLRNRRPRPHLDDKILTAWNGLMISALARAGGVLDEPDYLAAAAKAARFLLQHLRRADGRLLRTYRHGPGTIPAFAADYAFFIQGLLDLQEATGDLAWLREAWALQQQMDALFWDGRQGGYFDVSGEDPSILLRTKEEYDGAEPAPNSIAAMNLLRFSGLLHQPPLARAAEQTLRGAHRLLRGAPSAVPQMLAALSRHVAAPLHVVIVGAARDDRTRALWREAHRPFLPHKTILLLEPGQSLEFLGPQEPFFAGLVQAAAQPTAYVCENFACRLPVTEPAALREMLAPLA